MKIQENVNRQLRKKAENKKASGITLIALVITVLFSYDYGGKCSNSNKFLFLINC